MLHYWAQRTFVIMRIDCVRLILQENNKMGKKSLSQKGLRY